MMVGIDGNSTWRGALGLLFSCGMIIVAVLSGVDGSPHFSSQTGAPFHTRLFTHDSRTADSAAFALPGCDRTAAAARSCFTINSRLNNRKSHVVNQSPLLFDLSARIIRSSVARRSTIHIMAAGAGDDLNGVPDSCASKRDVLFEGVQEKDDHNGSRLHRGERRQRGLLGYFPIFIVGACTAFSQASTAALSGGRIGGGGHTIPDSARNAPPAQQQQQPQAPLDDYSPSTEGRDIYGSAGSRVRVNYRGKSGRRRGSRVQFNQDVSDVTSNRITPGDAVMIGGVSAGAVALQRYNRKRFLEEGNEHYKGYPGSAAPKASKETAVVTTLQLSMYCDRKGGVRDALLALDKLSQNADVNSPRGLSVLVNEVCLTLLRSEKDWIGAAGGIKEYLADGGRTKRGKKSTPQSTAKRDFNRAVMRERSKWERETVSNTPDRGFSSSTVPGWREPSGKTGGTYAVATLMVVWSPLRSIPPQQETRKRTWFWQDGSDSDVDDGFSVVNRKTAMTLLEWLGDEATEGRGENVMDIEVLWTPADPTDSLDRDDLDAKWPELRSL